MVPLQPMFPKVGYCTLIFRDTYKYIQPYLTKYARGNVEIPKRRPQLRFQSPETVLSAYTKGCADIRNKSPNQRKTMRIRKHHSKTAL